ncbi:MAG: DNA translocase FtsK 4TM domain-containing protein, partial [Bacteroidia bacterium]
MAKRKTNSRRSSSKRKSSSQQLDLFAGIRKWRSDPQSQEQSRKIFAWTLIFVGVLAFIAGISHFYHGRADASVAAAGEAQNILGYVGAIVANWYISKGFGILGLVIPLYVAFWGIVLLEDDFFHTAKRLLKFVVFGVLFGSTLLAFIVDVSSGLNFDLGGGVGHFLSRGLAQYVGYFGVGFLLLFALIIFLVVNFNAEMRASGLLNRVMGFVDSVGGIKMRPAIQGAGNNAPANKPAKKASTKKRTKPAPKSGDSLKDRVGKLLELEGTDGQVRSLDDTPASAGKEAGSDAAIPPPAAPGEQIAFELKTKKEPVKLKIENEDLELEIAEPMDEPVSDAEPESGTKEFIPLGDDNIGVVVGADKIEKIIKPEDQVNEGIEDFEAFDPTAELSSYEMPNRQLLIEHGDGQNHEVNREELVSNKNKIVETLKNYGIEIVSIKATVGPTVTLYEIVPAPGVRISKIKNLEDDIALSLAALGIRIIAPIPGRGTIGIEVPNSNPEIVSLKGVLATDKFRNTKAELPIALGRTIDNSVYIGDLNKMPHLLIAGATGQGKSVGLNTVIASILYKRHPAEVKFVLIDPKKVEMSLYQSLEKHYLATLPNVKEPIITDVREAITVLKSLCIEMDQRYDLLKAAKVRNLKEYNTKFLARKLSPRKGHFYMPYIVLVIDELADMMM